MQETHGRQKGDEYEIAASGMAKEFQAELTEQSRAAFGEAASAYRDAYALDLPAELGQIAKANNINGYHLAALLPTDIDPAHPGGLFQLSPEALEKNGIDPTASPAEQLRQGGRAFKRLLVGYKGDFGLAAAAFHAGTVIVDDIAAGKVEPSPEILNKVQNAVNKAMDTEYADLGLDHGAGSREKTINISDLPDSLSTIESIDPIVNARYADSIGVYAAEFFMGAPDEHLYTEEQLNEEIGYYEALRRGHNVEEEFFTDGPRTLRDIRQHSETNNLKARYETEIERVPDDWKKSLTVGAVHLGTDPLVWMPGSLYAKVLERVAFAGRVGTGVAKNAAKWAKGEELTKWSEITGNATEKMLEARQAYSISGNTLDRVTYSEWRNGKQLTFSSTEGPSTRLLLTSPEELSMVKEVGGAKLAEHIEGAVKMSADMPIEMKQVIQRGLDDLIRTDRAAAEELAKKLTRDLGKKRGKEVTVDDLPNMIDELGKVMDKTIVSYVDESGQLVTDVFTSYNQIVYNYKILSREFPGDTLVNGLNSGLPGVKPARVSGAHSEVLGQHRAGEKFKTIEIKQAGDQAHSVPVYNIPENAIVVKVVYGRRVCRRCLANVPAQARDMGFPRVLLFEADSGKAMFWQQSMTKDKLLYLGKVDRTFDASTITVKGFAVGTSTNYSQHAGHGSRK